jgi:nucleoside-diphosphate-sugar epimerase
VVLLPYMAGRSTTLLIEQATRRGRTVTAERSQILVTGAAGFIGRHTARACMTAGYSVTGVDVRPAPPGFAPGRWLRGDCVADHVVGEIADGRYVAVVHQAGVSDTRVPDTPDLRETNVHGPLRIAQTCHVSGTRLIYASSHSVYGHLRAREPIAEASATDTTRCSDPLNAYARSKFRPRPGDTGQIQRLKPAMDRASLHQRLRRR